MEAKTGGDELNGDRGAHKETKTKRARADEEKKGPQGPPKGSTIIGPGPPLGRSVRFTVTKPMFLSASFGRSKVLLGGLLGGGSGGPRLPRGALVDSWGGGSGPSLGDPWGSLGQLGEAEGRFWQTGGPAKSLVLFYKRVHFGLRKGPWGNQGGRGGGKNGRRRVEWGPRRPEKNKNKTSRSRRVTEGTPRAPQRHSDH